MRKLVFDIETNSFPFGNLSESQQEYILRAAEKEAGEELRQQKKDEAIRCLNLYPFTARVISIAFLDVLKEKRFVYYESDKDEEFVTEEVHFKGLTECGMLQSFWRIIERTDQVITFNGRAFDVPFLLIRSAINKIRSSKNLIRGRYDTAYHLDLLEQFSFYGLTRKFNLDFYCNAFGIPSPKTAGINGNEIPRLYEEGRIKEIAQYCADDVSATYELYKIWNEYLNITENR